MPDLPAPEAMIANSILYEDDEIVVIHRPAPAAEAGEPPLTLVTFADLTFRPDGYAIWGQEPATKLGLPAIGFVAKRENWFPAASIRRAAPAVHAALLGPALCYGYSMGGYAALKYARLLGVTRALGVCPQASISPADLPDDKRFHKFHERAAHAGMRLTRDEAPEFGVMMADPYHPDDLVNARMLQQDGGIHWVRTPFVGHAAIWLLTDTAFLREVLGLIQDADLPRLSTRLRERRHQNVHWFFWVAHHAFLRNKPALANRLWNRAEELGLDRNIREQEVMRLLGDAMRRLIDKGRRAEARALALRRAQECAGDAVVLAQIGHILIGMGEGEAAEEPFRAALALRRDVSHVYQGLSMVVASKGRLDEAIAIAMDGIREAPGDAGLHIHLGYLLLNAAKLEEAQGQFDIVLSQVPNHTGALTGKSNVLAAYGRQAEAIELMQQAVPLAPEDAGMRVWLGQLLLVVGEPAEAEPHFRVALEHAPQIGAAHIGLARSLERTGRLEEARHVAADAAAALPNDTRVQAIHRRMGPPNEPKPVAAVTEKEEEERPSGFRRLLGALFGR
ncbi:tetratricopeptide repeat protein [Roseomonas marmotae]|uniref:Tetratricopeptide repeat protein n=1 Tax=Roseomonas marmotae TaxID=2768161 RepID=A0ABS3KFP9_9PROT|nr:tetratricopeptide repeat protein [Roseomonas marmotae]MBO1076299.1 tetratricopeptide repeat protein [Roseomonas marmotae]QTI80542.1 tetratricopeptide repeat protein [Roseomonas marmotae]